MGGDAMSEWKPIETAPKDHDLVLLYRLGDGVRPGYWDETYWLATETQGLTGGLMQPTHWMPLPEGPKRHR